MSQSDSLDIDHAGLLSDATLSALQLRQQPFTEQPTFDSSALQSEEINNFEPFSDETTEEQLSDVKQALITGDDLLLILGEPGSGKSTLLRQLGAQSGLRIQCFAVNGSERFSTLNLFAGMLEAFKRKPPEKLKEILDELIPCLQTMVARNTLSVIILDDAHEVSQTELTQLLSGMLYVNSQDETLMRIALAASVEFEQQIPDLLPEGADMPYSSLTIDGHTPQRAAAYLAYRLEAAGFQDEFPFSERDMASLVDHSGGMPLKLHALTADVLNEKHGRLADNPPPELRASDTGSFMQSRVGKLALGALATVFIIGGLLMFLPQDSDNSSDQAVRDLQDSTAENQGTAELRLIEDSDSNEDNSASDETDQPIATTTSSTNNTDSQSSDVAQEASTAAAEQADTDITSSPDTPDTSNTDNNDVEVTDNNQERDTPIVIVAENSEQAEADDSSNEELTSSEETNSDSNAEDEAQQASDVETAVDVAADEVAADTEPAQQETEAEQEQTEDAAVAENQSDTDLPGSLESPTWILIQDSDWFTVQMSASRDRDSVENFLQRNPLPAPNSIFSFERNGVVWYALVHGLFPTLSDARQAVERMPEAALRNQPWIRSIGRVQGILRTP